MPSTIMVLNDGETFSEIGGCAIVDVPLDATTEEIEELLADEDRTRAATVGIYRENGALYPIEGGQQDRKGS
jgi:hypothetical protein